MYQTFAHVEGGRASPSLMRRQGVTIFDNSYELDFASFIYATLQHLQWMHLKHKFQNIFTHWYDISLSWYSLLSWTTNLKSPAYTSNKCQTLKEHYEN